MSEPRKRDPKVWDVQITSGIAHMTDGEYYVNGAASKAVVRDGRITLDLVLEKKSTRRVNAEKRERQALGLE
jgi:hypothetical protein